MGSTHFWPMRNESGFMPPFKARSMTLCDSATKMPFFRLELTAELGFREACVGIKPRVVDRLEFDDHA